MMATEGVAARRMLEPADASVAAAQNRCDGPSTSANTSNTSAPLPITPQLRATTNARGASRPRAAKPIEMNLASPPNDDAAVDTIVINSPTGFNGPTSTAPAPDPR